MAEVADLPAPLPGNSVEKGKRQMEKDQQAIGDDQFLLHGIPFLKISCPKQSNSSILPDNYLTKT